MKQGKRESNVRKCITFLVDFTRNQPEGNTGCLVCVFAQQAGLSLGGVKGKTMPESSPQKTGGGICLSGSSCLLCFIMQRSLLWELVVMQQPTCLSPHTYP